MARVTIIRAVWNKCWTQLSKPENAEKMAELTKVKRTAAPNQDQILWEPSKEALAVLEEQIRKEMSFTRDKTSKPYKDLETVLLRVKA